MTPLENGLRMLRHRTSTGLQTISCDDVAAVVEQYEWLEESFIAQADAVQFVAKSRDAWRARVEHLERQRDHLQRCNNDETERRRIAEAEAAAYEARFVRGLDLIDALECNMETQITYTIKLKEEVRFAIEEIGTTIGFADVVRRLQEALGETVPGRST